MSRFEQVATSPVVIEELKVVLDMYRAAVGGTGWKNIIQHVNAVLMSKGMPFKREYINVPFKFGEKTKQRIEADVVILKALLLKDGISLLATEDGFIAHTDASIIGTIGIGTGVTDYTVTVQGHEVFTQHTLEVIKANFDIKASPRCWRFSVDDRNLLEMREIPLSVPSKITGLKDFYPSLDKSPEAIMDEFLDSSANVLFLIGDPGLGKSTLILSMLNHTGWDDRHYYLIDSDVILKHPQLIDAIRGLRAGSVLIIEDADRFVGSREGGNEQMSGLLNISSGIATSGVKIMISTNLSNVSKVDPALIRPGRCHDVLRFEPLTPEQANKARAVLDLPPVEFTTSKLSLSEALNDKAKGQRKSQFGFQAVA